MIYYSKARLRPRHIPYLILCYVISTDETASDVLILKGTSIKIIKYILYKSIEWLNQVHSMQGGLEFIQNTLGMGSNTIFL